MKKFRFLRYIYGIALLLSLIGYWLDSDIPDTKDPRERRDGWPTTGAGDRVMDPRPIQKIAME